MSNQVPADVRCDVCIVGSGFAGSVLAAELARRGRRVFIAETGSRGDRAARLRQASGSDEAPARLAEHLHVPVAVSSNAAWAKMVRKEVGGNSNYWTAWALRPLENHFRMRTRYGVGEDWPIDYRELEPYYGRAELELGVAGADGAGGGPWRSTDYPLPPFDVSYADAHFAAACAALRIETHPIPVARNSRPYQGRVSCCLAGTCSDCPTTARYTCDEVHLPIALRSGLVTLRSELTATRLELGPDGAIVRLHCSQLDRSAFVVEAGQFILACNALETVRILLGSRQAGHEAGLGNGAGLVGRYLMDHPSVRVWAMADRPLQPGRTQATLISRHFEDGEQRREEAGFMLFIGGGTTPTEVAVELIEAGLYGAPFKEALRRRCSEAFVFVNKLECLPRADNRIELDERSRDYFGRPGVKVTFNLGDFERRSVAAMWRAVQPIARRMEATIVDDEDRLHMRGLGSHLLGGARMGRSAAESVVDRDLRAHGVRNLYVLGGAIFPNSLGPVNPTLTIVALALRLARHLATVRP